MLLSAGHPASPHTEVALSPRACRSVLLSCFQFMLQGKGSKGDPTAVLCPQLSTVTRAPLKSQRSLALGEGSQRAFSLII